MSVSGDTAIIGAHLDDNTGIGSGSAYVFTRSDGTWSQQSKLTASDGADGDSFGVSVSVSRDLAIVGAIHDDDNGSESGSAYVFVRNNDTWSQQSKLTVSGGAAYDRFGMSVSVSGNTAVIGAYQNDDNGSNSGAAYVFVRNGSVWSQQSKLAASDGASDDSFGYSVSISGDTAVIGAFGDDNNGNNSGSAYVFVRSNGTWSQQSQLTANDAAASDVFGVSVSVSRGTAIVGAYLDDNNGIDSGSAYVFTGCIASAQSGAWGNASTWVGGAVPDGTDGACVQTGHTVTLDAAAAVDTLQVFAGGTFDLSTYGFTAESGVWNYGTMQQTQDVDGSRAVNFLQIRNSGNTADQYRGIDIGTGTNLGTTVVRVIGNTAQCNNPATDGGAYRNRCFMVNPANAGTVAVTLHSTPGEDDISDDAFFQHAAGSTWTQGASCNDAVGAGGSCTGTATFASPAWFLIGSESSNPTAVSLQSFSASNNTALLPILIIMLLLAVIGGVVLRRRSG